MSRIGSGSSLQVDHLVVPSVLGIYEREEGI